MQKQFQMSESFNRQMITQSKLKRAKKFKPMVDYVSSNKKTQFDSKNFTKTR